MAPIDRAVFGALRVVALARYNLGLTPGAEGRCPQKSMSKGPRHITGAHQFSPRTSPAGWTLISNPTRNCLRAGRWLSTSPRYEEALGSVTIDRVS